MFAAPFHHVVGGWEMPQLVIQVANQVNSPSVSASHSSRSVCRARVGGRWQPLPLRPIAAPSLLQDNGYARLLRRQVEDVFRDNRMIAVCQYNSMPDEDMVLMRHYLRKHNIEVKFVLNEVGAELLGQIPLWLGGGKADECWERPRGACWGEKLHFKSCLPQIIRPMLSQSKYKNLLPLFVARNILLVSPETKVKEMLRVLKGVPQINLLGENFPCIPVSRCRAWGSHPALGRGTSSGIVHANRAVSAGSLLCLLK